jgi:hypothetical protein
MNDNYNEYQETDYHDLMEEPSSPARPFDKNKGKENDKNGKLPRN